MLKRESERFSGQEEEGLGWLQTLWPPNFVWKWPFGVVARSTYIMARWLGPWTEEREGVEAKQGVQQLRYFKMLLIPQLIS